MNSEASTHVARMFGLSTASLWASVTTLGQCGHVGVTNTWISSGPETCCATSCLLS